MSSLNIESVDLRAITKEVIREIVLERVFATKSKFVSEVSLGELTNSVETEDRSLVWDRSYRRDLMSIPVGGVQYFNRPRKLSATKHRARYARARYSLRNFFNADFKFTRTATALKVERIK